MLLIRGWWPGLCSFVSEGGFFAERKTTLKSDFEKLLFSETVNQYFPNAVSMLSTNSIPEELLRVDGRIAVRWFWSPGQPVRENVRLVLRSGILEDVQEPGNSVDDVVLPILCIPPLVNAHTHLEFSGLSQPLLPPSPFPDWIDSVIAYRSTAFAESDVAGSTAAIEQGISECTAQGVAGVGEIATRSDTATIFARCGVWVRIFREYLGLAPDRAGLLLEDAVRFIQATRTVANSRVLPGLSPHAPYSVSEELFLGLAELARIERLPLAMHLAETREELELLTSGSGPFRDFLERRGLWRKDQFSGALSVRPFLEVMANLDSGLAIHCNYLSDDEIRFVGANPQIRVVYCPRTHAYFGHTAHPWQRIQQAGGRVLLGTDSRASNPCLSLWKELLHVLRFGDLRDADPFRIIPSLLAMVSSDAAEALGFPRSAFAQQVGCRGIQL